MSKQSPKTYTDCSDTPIYNFMMYAHTSDYKYLISNLKKLSETAVKDYLERNAQGLKKLGGEIEYEYRGLVFNAREFNKQRDIALMMALEVQHNAIVKTVDLYLKTKEIKILDLLNKLDVTFDKNNPIEPQLKKAKAMVQSLRNQIGIKTASFKAKYKIDDTQLAEQKQSQFEDIEKALDSQALSMEANLETGYRINIKKTSVLRWVNLLEANERKIEQLNKK